MYHFLTKGIGIYEHQAQNDVNKLVSMCIKIKHWVFFVK